MLDVVIVGGGISGLSLAFYLLKEGLRDIVLIESSREFGGKIGTLVEDGYVIEKGPNGFLDNKPYTLNLSYQLGIDKDLIPSSDFARRRYVFVNGRLTDVPLNPLSFMFSPILSVRGKLRMFYEVFMPPRTDDYDETVGEFGERRLGKEFVEKLLDPMVTGVFAGDVYRLSLKASFPLIWDLERNYGGLFKALFKMAFGGKLRTGPGGFSKLFSYKMGLFQLVDALVNYLKGKVTLKSSETVERVAFDKDHWVIDTNKESYRAKSLVIATPSYIASSLIGDEYLSNLLDAIEYAPIVVCAIGGYVKDGREPVGFGFLVPKIENKTILGCLFDSQIFPGRAPSGKLLLRAMIGGRRHPWVVDFDDAFILGETVFEVESILRINLDIEKWKIFRYEKGIPQYERGHLDRVETIFSTVRKNYKGLFLHGNAYKGVGMNDCVYNSMLLAREIREYLAVS